MYTLRSILHKPDSDVLQLRHEKIKALFPLLEVLYLNDSRIQEVRWFRSPDKSKSLLCIAFTDENAYINWDEENKDVRKFVNDELDQVMINLNITENKSVVGDISTWFTDTDLVLENEIIYPFEYPL